MDLNVKLSEDIPTNKGVRQECPTSPTLFNIYMDGIFQRWTAKVDSGISLQRNIHVNALLYTDYKVMIQKTEEQLHRGYLRLIASYKTMRCV